ncbi:translation initiation factor IF-2-like [Lutra lutra]|uniref:translation initiation factor IF-2-like n=1 Tax=Lutra lutra TaxID=9657 RepID=UPI001FD41CE7|nr:translation initiation factor IF-2-like [Lutra lutra]
MGSRPGRGRRGSRPTPLARAGRGEQRQRRRRQEGGRPVASSPAGTCGPGRPPAGPARPRRGKGGTEWVSGVGGDAAGSSRRPSRLTERETRALRPLPQSAPGGGGELSAPVVLNQALRKLQEEEMSTGYVRREDCEITRRKHPFASQEQRPQEKPVLLTP